MMSDARQSAQMPAYIERGGEQELLPPCGLYGSQFYVFILQGNRVNLQNLLDRLFNQPSGGALNYEAFSSYVAVMFTHVDRLTSAEPAQGWAAYGDIAMWVPVIDRQGILPSFKMYPVYMVVDNGSTMATGREIYGFPKEMGWFLEPQIPEFIGDLAVDVTGYRADSPTKQSIRSRLYSVQRDTGNAPAAFNPLASARAVLDEVERAMTLLHRASLEDEFIVGFDIFKNMFSIPALGLKQIRDIQTPSNAVFRSVVEAPLGITKFRDARLLTDKYTFTLNDLASHPVANDTGLKIGAQDVVLAFWLFADFELGVGRTNWQSPAIS
jgi:Acetoacetate decarboxylase (ADC)